MSISVATTLPVTSVGIPPKSGLDGGAEVEGGELGGNFGPLGGELGPLGGELGGIFGGKSSFGLNSWIIGPVGFLKIRLLPFSGLIRGQN